MRATPRAHIVEGAPDLEGLDGLLWARDEVPQLTTVAVERSAIDLVEDADLAIHQPPVEVPEQLHVWVWMFNRRAIRCAGL